jgi:hypothetical protein
VSAAATPVQTGLRYGWAFWRAAFRPLTWRLAAGSLATGFLLRLACSTNWSEYHSRIGEHLISELITVTILTASFVTAMLAADEAIGRGAPRFSTCAIAVLIGAAVSVAADVALLTAADLPTWHKGLRWEHAYGMLLGGGFLMNAIFGGLAVFAYVHLRLTATAARTRNAAEIARVQAKRSMLESQLQAMQARVEPQFLFDTLAQVRALYERDPAIAGKLLDDLIDYLRGALPHLRDSSSTLGKEIALAKAYLHIVHVQRGDELALALDIPDALSAARVPPMLLLPLVQRVLTQGRPAEGTPHALAIAAVIDGSRLRITITGANGGFGVGVGFPESSTQLSSVASRMSALYGDAGAFRIEQDPARGSRVILEMPYEIADDDHC